MVISLIERESAVHTGCCVCISSAGRQCPGAGSGLPSSTDGGGACQFVEPRARASCWALRHLMKTQMATRMMTRACAESSRRPRAVDASMDVCAGPHDDGEDHGPGDARLALLPRVAAALLCTFTLTLWHAQRDDTRDISDVWLHAVVWSSQTLVAILEVAGQRAVSATARRSVHAGRQVQDLQGRVQGRAVRGQIADHDVEFQGPRDVWLL